MRVPAALFLLTVAGCNRPAPPAPVKAAPAAPASLPSSQPTSRAAAPLPTHPKAAPLGENRTGTRYEDPACTGETACACETASIFHGRSALARIGVDLEMGKAPCLLADFDGNGHTDAAFFAKETEILSRGVVLFFDAGGLSAIADLPKSVAKPTSTADVPGKAVIADGKAAFVWDGKRFVVGLRGG